MWCGKCNEQFPHDCTCADRDERVASLAGSSHLASRWCVRCDKHYGFCECGEYAEWMMKSGGRTYPLPAHLEG
ncbi:hypothetical protein LCGC14_2423640 [marine sediment metagenome]|uniref:Uncharacterized protein n=1 Tax=marine sediment metagenome TaxID=412755 RepID=A0A0F9E106_9ZZZZ